MFLAPLKNTIRETQTNQTIEKKTETEKKQKRNKTLFIRINGIHIGSLTFKSNRNICRQCAWNKIYKGEKLQRNTRYEIRIK